MDSNAVRFTTSIDGDIDPNEFGSGDAAGSCGSAVIPSIGGIGKGCSEVEGFAGTKGAVGSEIDIGLRTESITGGITFGTAIESDIDIIQSGSIDRNPGGSGSGVPEVPSSRNSNIGSVRLSDAEPTIGAKFETGPWIEGESFLITESTSIEGYRDTVHSIALHGNTGVGAVVGPAIGGGARQADHRN